MKRILCLTLSLILLLSAGLACAEADTLETLTCPELGFSTLLPAGLTAKLNEEEKSVTVYLEDPGYVPNIWIYPRGSKLNDPVSFMHEKYPAFMEEKYGDNLAATSKYEYYEIAGMKLNAVGFIYRDADGNAVNQLNLVLPLEKEDVEFEARYANSGKDAALSALETLIRYYQPDADYYSRPQTSEPSKTAAYSFAVTNILQDNMIIGRCTAPADFTVTHQAMCCTRSQSLENPWQLAISATSPEGVGLFYSSAQTFYDDGTGESQDGGYYSKMMMPAFHYMNAADYCDYMARSMNASAPQITLVEETNFPELQETLQKSADAYKNVLNTTAGGTGINVPKVENTICARIYYMESESGLPYYFVVATSTLGVWNELYGIFGELVNSYVLWTPLCVYSMFCPAHLWEANQDIFPVFMENTSVTDQFLAANQRLSIDLQSLLTGIDLSGGSDYSYKIMAQETSKGNDYDDERFTDYIFDQNDYTLSDGSHVKISTIYDYVWTEGDGNVWYSSNASDMPYGATRLYPNQ